MSLAATTLALLLIQAPVPVPVPSPVPKAPVPTAAHHQFDFWLGEWEVLDPAGLVVGHNRIESVSAGFALLEHWSDLAGGSGKSLNAYDAIRGGWHQTWVGSGGEVIQFDGGFAEGRMCMEGTRTTAKGLVRDRMTWSPRRDGTVRQLWELSSDEGKSWQILFDGIYRRLK